MHSTMGETKFIPRSPSPVGILAISLFVASAVCALAQQNSDAHVAAAHLPAVSAAAKPARKHPAERKEPASATTEAPPQFPPMLPHALPSSI